MIFLGLKFWLKVIFWVYERCQDFLGCRKKQRDFFWLQKKGLSDIFGHAKEVTSDFLSRQILKLCFFWV